MRSALMEFEYSRRWYETEYHGRGAYHLPERTYADVMDEWAPRKSRLYRVLGEAESYVDIGSVGRCLEAGCHHGKTAFWMAERYSGMRIAAVDFSWVAVRWCAWWSPFVGRIGFGQADVSRVPFVASSFDLVTCLDVAEHLPVSVYTAMLAELYRVQKPGGHLVFFCGQTALPEHINLRSMEQVQSDLEAAGFSLVALLPECHTLWRKG